MRKMHNSWTRPSHAAGMMTAAILGFFSNGGGCLLLLGFFGEAFSTSSAFQLLQPVSSSAGLLVFQSSSQFPDQRPHSRRLSFFQAKSTKNGGGGQEALFADGDEASSKMPRASALSRAIANSKVIYDPTATADDNEEDSVGGKKKQQAARSFAVKVTPRNKGSRETFFATPYAAAAAAESLVVASPDTVPTMADDAEELATTTTSIASQSMIDAVIVKEEEAMAKISNSFASPPASVIPELEPSQSSSSDFASAAASIPEIENISSSSDTVDSVAAATLDKEITPSTGTKEPISSSTSTPIDDVEPADVAVVGEGSDDSSSLAPTASGKKDDKKSIPEFAVPEWVLKSSIPVPDASTTTPATLIPSDAVINSNNNEINMASFSSSSSNNRNVNNKPFEFPTSFVKEAETGWDPLWGTGKKARMQEQTPPRASTRSVEVVDTRRSRPSSSENRRSESTPVETTTTGANAATPVPPIQSSSAKVDDTNDDSEEIDAIMEQIQNELKRMGGESLPPPAIEELIDSVILDSNSNSAGAEVATPVLPTDNSGAKVDDTNDDSDEIDASMEQLQKELKRMVDESLPTPATKPSDAVVLDYVSNSAGIKVEAVETARTTTADTVVERRSTPPLRKIVKVELAPRPRSPPPPPKTPEQRAREADQTLVSMEWKPGVANETIQGAALAAFGMAAVLLGDGGGILEDWWARGLVAAPLGAALAIGRGMTGDMVRSVGAWTWNATTYGLNNLDAKQVFQALQVSANVAREVTESTIMALVATSEWWTDQKATAREYRERNRVAKIKSELSNQRILSRAERQTADEPVSDFFFIASPEQIEEMWQLRESTAGPTKDILPRPPVVDTVDLARQFSQSNVSDEPNVDPSEIVRTVQDTLGAVRDASVEWINEQNAKAREKRDREKVANIDLNSQRIRTPEERKAEQNASRDIQTSEEIQDNGQSFIWNSVQESLVSARKESVGWLNKQNAKAREKREQGRVADIDLDAQRIRTRDERKAEQEAAWNNPKEDETAQESDLLPTVWNTVQESLVVARKESVGWLDEQNAKAREKREQGRVADIELDAQRIRTPDERKAEQEAAWNENEDEKTQEPDLLPTVWNNVQESLVVARKESAAWLQNQNAKAREKRDEERVASIDLESQRIKTPGERKALHNAEAKAIVDGYAPTEEPPVLENELAAWLGDSLDSAKSSSVSWLYDQNAKVLERKEREKEAKKEEEKEMMQAGKSLVKEPPQIKSSSLGSLEKSRETPSSTLKQAMANGNRRTDDINDAVVSRPSWPEMLIDKTQVVIEEQNEPEIPVPLEMVNAKDSDSIVIPLETPPPAEASNSFNEKNESTTDVHQAPEDIVAFENVEDVPSDAVPNMPLSFTIPSTEPLLSNSATISSPIPTTSEKQVSSFSVPFAPRTDPAPTFQDDKKDESTTVTDIRKLVNQRETFRNEPKKPTVLGKHTVLEIPKSSKESSSDQQLLPVDSASISEEIILPLDPIPVVSEIAEKQTDESVEVFTKALEESDEVSILPDNVSSDPSVQTIESALDSEIKSLEVQESDITDEIKAALESEIAIDKEQDMGRRAACAPEISSTITSNVDEGAALTDIAEKLEEFAQLNAPDEENDAFEPQEVLPVENLAPVPITYAKSTARLVPDPKNITYTKQVEDSPTSKRLKRETRAGLV